MNDDDCLKIDSKLIPFPGRCFVTQARVRDTTAEYSKLPYTPQFRQQMVELVMAGRNPSELAKQFNGQATSVVWLPLVTGQGDGGTSIHRASGRRIRQRYCRELLSQLGV